jgi:YaeQ protein
MVLRFGIGIKPCPLGCCRVIGFASRMALTATMHHFHVMLSDVDRGVYKALDLRVARHPSESGR